MRRFSKGLAVFCILSTALPFIRTDVGWIRILDFPRLQLAVVCLTAIIMLLCFVGVRTTTSRILFALVGVSFLYQLFKVAQFTPLWRPEIRAHDDNYRQDRFSVFQANVKMSNRESDKLLQIIGQRRPDILSINEPDEWWEQQLQSIEKMYPYSIKKPLPNTYGMILYSRFPLHDTSVNFLVADSVPSFYARVALPSGGTFNLHCVHPEPPRPGSSSYERDTELFILGRRIKKERQPSLVVGDINDVAWSRTTERFKEMSGARDPRKGRGLYNTFNANWPLLRYPLDHFFLTGHFVLHKLEKLDNIGSDHFPMFIEVSLDK